MSSIQADGGNNSSGHSFNHADQSGHHVLNVGDLSNDNMLGTDYQYWNLKHFAEGLKINTGMRFAILFIAFAGWLYIIYWIRHHEPFANQAIGVQTSLAPTANEDKRMVAAIKNAFPWRTSANMGNLFVPSPQGAQLLEESSPNNANRNNQTTNSDSGLLENRFSVGPGQAISAPIVYPKLNIDQRFGLPTNSQLPCIEPAMTNNMPIEANSHIFANPAIQQTPSTYQITVCNGKSNLLRTVVSR